MFIIYQWQYGQILYLTYLCIIDIILIEKMFPQSSVDRIIANYNR